MKNIIIILLATIALISCKKADNPTTRITYKTRCNSTMCHIEYADYVTSHYVQVDSVPGNFEYSFTVPKSDTFRRFLFSIGIEDQLKDSTGAYAEIYYDDSLRYQGGGLNSAATHNLK